MPIVSDMVAHIMMAAMSDRVAFVLHCIISGGYIWQVMNSLVCHL